MLKKITQVELENLLELAYLNKIVDFKQLLKENNFSSNLRDLIVDLSLYNNARMESLDFSGLVLKNTAFKNVKNVRNIDFSNSDLEGASINRESILENVNFTNANLKDIQLAGCRLSGEALFNNANLEDSRIYADNFYNFLDEKQKEDALVLRSSNTALFSQGLLIEHLNSKTGSCQGITDDYLRFSLNGKSGYVEKVNRKINNPQDSQNYFKRIDLYQKYLNTIWISGVHLYLDKGKLAFDKIKSQQFFETLPDDVKNSKAFVMILNKSGNTHQIAITAVLGKNQEIIGYKIFDPNIGELDCSNGKNKEENIRNLNQQIHNLIRLYKKHNIDYSKFIVADVEKPFKALGIVKSDVYQKEDKYLPDSKVTKFDIIMALLEYNGAPGKLVNYFAKLLEGNKTPLEIGSASNLELTVKMAIRRGDDLNVRDSNNITPMHAAARNGHSKILQMLLKAGADANPIDKNDMTPIQLAAQNGQTAAFKLLAKAGCNPCEPNHDNKQLIHWAAQAGDSETVLDLIAKGVDPNIPDNNGNTPLYWANAGKQADTCLSLLKAGASLQNLSYYPEICFYFTKPSYFSDKSILNLFKEAIEQDDLITIGNLLKNNAQVKNKGILKFAQDKPEIAAFLISQGVREEQSWSDWTQEKIGLKDKANPDEVAEKIGGNILDKYQQRKSLIKEIHNKKSKNFVDKIQDRSKSSEKVI